MLSANIPLSKRSMPLQPSSIISQPATVNGK